MTSIRDHHDILPVYLAAAGTIHGAIALLANHLTAATPLVLPSSGSRRDILAATVRTQLRESGTRSALFPFSHGPIPSAGGSWRPVRIEPPDSDPYEVALPARILDATSVVVVTDVHKVVGGSPTVLDLLARYLRWRDRLRLRATRNTSWVPEINLARDINCIIASLLVDNGVIAVATDDVIAGELFALALAEELLPSDSHLTGVWEDPLVQRATELGRWVRYPGEIAPTVAIEAGSDDLRGAIEQILARVGVRTP